MPQINLLAGWAGLLFGFASGLALGFGFHHERWLGGYASLQRRLYRLGHVAFFGIGAVNILFYCSLAHAPLSSSAIVASRFFLIALPAMPLACVLMAHFPKARPLFALPVLSLLCGAVLTLIHLSKL